MISIPDYQKIFLLSLPGLYYSSLFFYPGSIVSYFISVFMFVVSDFVLSPGMIDSISNFFDPGNVVRLEMSYPMMTIVTKKIAAAARNIRFDLFNLIFQYGYFYPSIQFPGFFRGIACNGFCSSVAFSLNSFSLNTMFGKVPLGLFYSFL